MRKVTYTRPNGERVTDHGLPSLFAAYRLLTHLRANGCTDLVISHDG